MNQITIDLNRFRSSKSAVFAGRERGNEVRKILTDEELNKADEISFIVPNDVSAMNSSFILGLLGETISQKHKAGIDAHYVIKIPAGFERSFENAFREAIQSEILI